jgi:hypothetical protein
MKSANPLMRLGPVIAGLLLSTSAFAQGYKGEAKATEVALLPHFCWAQYMDDPPPGDEFRISKSACGSLMNHYCPGLVLLDRATKPYGTKSKGEKRQNLVRAKESVVYTLKGMANYPACPIRSHVETTLARINALLLATK